MPDERTTRDLLLALEHIEEVADYFIEIKSPADFVKSKQGRAYYDAILMRLQAAGELLKRNFTEHPDLFLQHAEIPWNEIIRMRDLISHHYDKLQHEVVFDICDTALPELKVVLKKITG
ncbi:MAG: HepT-like ribonuclease domain-containing protein [Chitinophagales bacterium]|nr:HepT-like ribonuclease domain-containing protein [Chitinophagales bacterium]